MALPEGSINLNRHFFSFLGQTVTVCVEGQSSTGRCFSGVLAGVYQDHIRLLNFVERTPTPRRYRRQLGGAMYRTVYGCRPFKPGFIGHGVVTCLPTGKIVAFTHADPPFAVPPDADRDIRAGGISLHAMFTFALAISLLFGGRRTTRPKAAPKPVTYFLPVISPCRTSFHLHE